MLESLNPSPGQIEVRVTDNGIGIEPDKLDRIFNAFEQGQVSITRRFGGLGLGLAISKAMVEAHGGRIRAESRGKDQGATFTISLKTVTAPTVATAPDGDRGHLYDKREMPDAKRHRVLVVDDHEDTCTGMKMMLQRRGYDIEVAYNADQALAKAQAEDFDLLISDIGLPDRSGYELMRELSGRGLRGIALSGFGSEHDINKAHAAGFAEHLTKPINFDKLEEAIRGLLDGEPNGEK